ncbi:hypothetical protein LBMAG52_33050 [Planctomycetia bacterium]|nr:hypothetical protein LBMAG52_33050 [Planctomycetia bacterium]
MHSEVYPHRQFVAEQREYEAGTSTIMRVIIPIKDILISEDYHSFVRIPEYQLYEAKEQVYFFGVCSKGI